MPLLVGSQLDLMKIPVLGLVAESSAAASPPAAPVNGQQWYDTTNDRLMVREAAAWQPVSNVGVELTANKGAASGYASLDGSTKVPIAQIPTGTTGSTVALGNDARFSDSRAPSGTAGGVLSGSYPNPGLADGAVSTAAKIANSIITDVQVAAANKDGIAGTASMRTLGTGAQQAMPGSTRLDTIAAPTGSVAMNSQRITGLGSPTADTDAATKGYVDAARTGLDVKASVRAATTATTGTYTATGGTSARGQITAAPNVVDGVTLAAGNRVLVKDHSTAAARGIYTVTTVGTGANGVWDRATDFDSDAEVTSGAFTFVEEGTTLDNTGWVLSTNDPITIGGGSGTSLVFVQFSGGASLTAGNGLTQTGSTFDVVGTVNRIVANADSIDIAATYVGQTSITTLGTISTGVWQGTAVALGYGGTGATSAAAARINLATASVYDAVLGAVTAGVALQITHNLNTQRLNVEFIRVSDGARILFEWRTTAVNTIEFTSAVTWSASALAVFITAKPA